MGYTTLRRWKTNRTLYFAIAVLTAILWCAWRLPAADPRPAPVSGNSGPDDVEAEPPREIPLPRANMDPDPVAIGHDTDAQTPAATGRFVRMRGVPTPAGEEPAPLASVKIKPFPSDDSPSTAVKSSVSKNESDENADDDSSESTAFAKTFDDLPPQPAVKIDAAALNGVQPGKTTAEELTQKWGKGKVTSAPGADEVQSFVLESFPRVDVTLVDGVVKSIVIQLAKPVSTAALAKQLQIADVRPVNIPDESGEPLGQAYPERGVLLTFAPGGKLASHIALEKIDFDSFVLRAELNLDTQCHRSQADLDYVLSQQPQHARALFLRAKLLTTLARYDEALASCEAAIAADDNQLSYRLLRGEILGRLGKYDMAAQQTKDVLDAAGNDQELKAKTLCQLANLLADSPAHDYKLAMDQHLAAIKTAEILSDDKHASVRRAAKQVLIEANLGVANDIACGVYSQKEQVIPKWLQRASTYAEDTIANESGDLALRLRVDRGALAACAAVQGKIDPVPWTRQALQQGKQLIAATDDSWRKRRLEWELGTALSDSLTADQLRGVTQHALDNATLTISYLEDGAKGRRDNPEDAFRLGWMYYRVGALHAVSHKDHKTAVTWYEKALPLLDRPIPATQHSQQGHFGEWFVSMGITYWEVGIREEAMDLSDAGMQHVEEAVRQKLIDPKALTVPYNNLAAMHQALGHSTEAKNFAEMAAKFDKPVDTPTIKR